MKTSRLTLLVLVASFVSVSAVYAQDTVQYVLAGKLLDINSGKLMENMLITISNGTISEISESSNLSQRDNLIDLSDYTVLPGLIDCHTHLTDPSYIKDFDYYAAPAATYGILGTKFAKQTLEAGFTTVRDVGGIFYSDTALRDAINKKWIVGPRMYVSGTALTITGGHGAWGNWLSPSIQFVSNPGNPVDGVDEMRKATRTLIKNNVDLIKIYASGGFGTSESVPGAASFTIDEMRAAVEEATKRGLKVAAHAHGAEGINNAVKAGVHSIEHASFLSQENIELMRQNKVYLVMDLMGGYVDLIENNEDYGDKQLGASNNEVYHGLEKRFKQAYDQNVLMAFGTDASIFEHGRNAEQFKLMHKAGMQPLDIIKSATINAADLIGILENAGSIETGKWADLIAVKGNPLEDVKVLEEVFFVMKEGTVYLSKL